MDGFYHLYSAEPACEHASTVLQYLSLWCHCRSQRERTAASSCGIASTNAAAAEAKSLLVELYLQLLVAVLLMDQGAEVRAHHGRQCAMGHCCHCLTYVSCHPPCFLPLTLAHAS